ncbi:hypothetical protein [Clostridium sp.]|uniref:hypothetical protein n=1 Tax=Clostridium sp. TaxID=1506 RepID=UPI002605CA1E|nr:hypothetical protein [Clostridium sp.]
MLTMALTHIIGGDFEIGLDRTKLFIRNVNINALININTIWTSYSAETFKDKYKHRITYYKHGVMVCDTGVFHLEYLRISLSNGDLIISFSIAKAFNGNNSIPKSNISDSDLYSLLESRLNYVLDMKQLPSMDTWITSYDEKNCDIVDTKENLIERFKLLRKTKVPYKKLDDSSADEGTLYFYSGKTRNKSSSVLIIYFKVKEQHDKNIDISQLLSLDDSMEDLRIEQKDNRRSIKRKLAKYNNKKNKLFGMYHKTTTLKPLDKQYYKYYNIFQTDINQCIPFNKINLNALGKCLKPPPSGLFEYLNHGLKIKIKANIADTLDPNYQFSIIRDFIKSCNLDKKITTKDKLYGIIDKSPLFSKTTKITAKRVIRYLNGEINTINLNSRTVDNYRKLILQTGYNYLYAAKELKPIKEEDILRIIQEDKNLNMIS